MNNTMSESPIGLDVLLHNWWKYNKERITSQSLTDCHVKGLNSIMFNSVEGQRVRLFSTDEDHELDHPSSVAFHTHRYDIKIIVLSGMLINYNAKFSKNENGTYKQYRYRSCILDGNGGFDLNSDERYERVIDKVHLLASDMMHLPWHRYHTVVVPTGVKTSWIILESTPVNEYEPVVYSNIDITTVDLSRLYNPISQEKIDRILNEVLYA
ncbi:MAG: hypothetical protein LAT56_14680 [Wenzhouxiangella sp.]|nr:hypothetical protein [Wenzhouxiangella sp.]